MSFSQIVWGVIGLGLLVGILWQLRKEWQEANEEQQREPKWPYF